MKRLIDEIDRRLLAELTQDSRISHASLGKKINLSRNAVRSRIERLERDGYIKGYTIITSVHNEPRQRFSAMLLVYRHDRMRGGEVIQLLHQIPEIVSCDIMSGEFDIIVRLEASDVDRVREIWRAVASAPGVRDTLTAFVLSPLIRRV